MLTEFDARLFKFAEKSLRMHLYDAGVPTVLGLVDEDGDGYIDEPVFDINLDGVVDEADRVDLDGDGKVGNTSLKLADYIDSPAAKSGIAHPTCTVNVNRVRPPKYFKVVNNTTEAGVPKAVYSVFNTSGADISDGGWYRDAGEADTMGGFFGTTRFIYGEGEGEYLLGTDKTQTVSASFKFTDEYYE